MDQLAPTWDLFILVFFAIIVAYSFIVGRNATLKIIIATYIAILAADGIGNFVDKLLLTEGAVINLFTAADASSLVVLKILIFVLSIVLLAIRGSFFVDVPADRSMLMSLATTGTFGFLSAGLIVSTILVYISGGSFVFDPTIAQGAGIDITSSSSLAQTMTANYNFWFSMPAIAFVISSFVGGGEPAISAEE